MVMAVFSAGETRVEAASSRTLPSRSRRVALGQGLDGQMIDVHRVLLRAGGLFGVPDLDRENRGATSRDRRLDRLMANGYSAESSRALEGLSMNVAPAAPHDGTGAPDRVEALFPTSSSSTSLPSPTPRCRRLPSSPT